MYYPCSIVDEKIVWLTSDNPIHWREYLFTIVPNWPYWPRKIPRRRYYRVTRASAISKYIVSRNPEVIFAILPEAYYLAVTALQICKFSVPVIASIRNTVSRKHSFNSFQIYKRFLRYAQFAQTVSIGIAEEIKSLHFLPEERIHCIYNPSSRPDIADYSCLPSNNPWVDCKKELGHKVVLAVGRLVKQKNFKLLIDAFADVVSVEPAKLLILGEGGERERLHRQIERLQLSDHVQLLGRCKNPYSYMSRCDVFVLSSNFEGLPNVLIEALQCGCKIVSTDCRHGPNEILGDGEWGTLVPCGDRVALAAAILRSINLDANRESLMKRAMDFTPERILPEYERLICRAIGVERRGTRAHITT